MVDLPETIIQTGEVLPLAPFRKGSVASILAQRPEATVQKLAEAALFRAHGESLLKDKKAKKGCSESTQRAMRELRTRATRWQENRDLAERIGSVPLALEATSQMAGADAARGFLERRCMDCSSCKWGRRV